MGDDENNRRQGGERGGGMEESGRDDDAEERERGVKRAIERGEACLTASHDEEKSLIE